MVSVVGDDRSGDPLHERCDESDVYEGEVAQVDMVPELVGWFDGVINGLRSLVDVARGSVGGVTGNVFEEVEERFAHPSVCVHHERDEFLVHCARRGLVLTVLSTIALCDGVGSRRRLTLRGSGWLVWSLACAMMCVTAVSTRTVMPVWRRPSMRMSGCLPRVVPSGFTVPGISPTGSSKVESPAALQTACTANFSLSWVLLALPPALPVATQSRWSKAWRGSSAAWCGLQQRAIRWWL